VVHRFTFGIDSLWKQEILLKIPPSKRVLDLACGTGILSFAIKKKYPGCEVIGVDITEGYLEVARRKAAERAVSGLSFVRSSAEDFFSDKAFDAVTTSYLPKYADLPRLVRNVGKMLRPGGVFLLHDFTYPSSKLLQRLFEAYFNCAQPIGSWFYPEWKEVLLELPKVIRKSPWVSELTDSLRREGFLEIAVQSLTLQGAALVSAKRPGARQGTS